MTKTLSEVGVKPLTVHQDKRGYLYEVWRSDEDAPPVEQIIVTSLYPGIVKGWHKHNYQWDQIVCVSGRIIVGWWHPDDEVDNTVILSPMGIKKVIIPPGYYHGFKNIGENTAIVLECVSEMYDKDNPDDQRVDPHQNHGEVWVQKDS